MEFYSLYSNEELQKFKSRDDINYVLGYGEPNDILRPPLCKTCGGFCYLDFKMGYAVCSECGAMSRFYTSKNLVLNKEWSRV